MKKIPLEDIALLASASIVIFIFCASLIGGF